MFAYPAGAWALLGLFAVLAIHLLRRRPRRETVATLFLIESAILASPGGRRLERVRHSVSLWLQLFAAALLAWLLMGPRLLREETTQKVAVVLDSTASLGPFRVRAEAALAGRAERLQRRAARTEWVLLESGLHGPPLYAGADAAALLRAAAAAWDPRWPAHDLQPALDQAREAVGARGLVLLVTDHEVPVPAGVDRIAVGQPIDNVGFAGARIEPDGSWKAVVKNNGREQAVRAWSVTVAGRRTPGGTLTLAPDEVRVLSGPLPPEAASLALELDADAFPLDDRLPLVAPRLKALRVRVNPEAEALPFVARFLATLDGIVREEPADLAIVVAPAGVRPVVSCPAVVLRPGGPGRLLPAAASAATHALVQELDWSGLLVPESPALAPAPGDDVLVWAGPRPLVVLARTAKGPVLIADFPLAGSSAERVPAFPLLLHRFAEEVRARVVGREQGNFETGASLTVALRGDGAAVVLEPESGPARETSAPRAPLSPGFFRVREARDERLMGAARFADAAEADFRQASSHEEDGEADGQIAARNRREHPLVPWATLLAALLMALDWALLSRGA
jgi:hypothetical protein